jgi:hypothetical protein
MGALEMNEKPQSLVRTKRQFVVKVEVYEVVEETPDITEWGKSTDRPTRDRFKRKLVTGNETTFTIPVLEYLRAVKDQERLAPGERNFVRSLVEQVLSNALMTLVRHPLRGLSAFIEEYLKENPF